MVGNHNGNSSLIQPVYEEPQPLPIQHNQQVQQGHLASPVSVAVPVVVSSSPPQAQDLQFHQYNPQQQQQQQQHADYQSFNNGKNNTSPTLLQYQHQISQNNSSNQSRNVLNMASKNSNNSSPMSPPTPSSQSIASAPQSHSNKQSFFPPFATPAERPSFFSAAKEVHYPKFASAEVRALKSPNMQVPNESLQSSEEKVNHNEVASLQQVRSAMPVSGTGSNRNDLFHVNKNDHEQQHHDSVVNSQGLEDAASHALLKRAPSNFEIAQRNLPKQDYQLGAEFQHYFSPSPRQTPYQHHLPVRIPPSRPVFNQQENQFDNSLPHNHSLQNMQQNSKWVSQQQEQHNPLGNHPSAHFHRANEFAAANSPNNEFTQHHQQQQQVYYLSLIHI